MHILGVHGDLLEGLFLHILGWMLASNLSGGTTGTSLRMNEVHVSTSIDALDQVVVSQTEPHGQENWLMRRLNNLYHTCL